MSHPTPPRLPSHGLAGNGCRPRLPAGYGMIAGVSGIYDEPELYQLACAYRDVKAEASALLAWCDAHLRPQSGEAGRNSAVRDAAVAAEPAGATEPAGAASRSPGSVLELAAGPAEHARELARRGLRASALDLSPAMSDYAAAQARADGVALEVVTADMRDFRITGPDGEPRRFDLAITMLNSLCHLFTLDDLVSHLTAVAAHVRPGGLYIVEFAHPADFFDQVPRTSSEWAIDVGGTHAEVRWGGRTDRIDPLTQVTDEHMTITATTADGLVRTVSDVVPNRFWTLTEFTAAVRLAAALPASTTNVGSPGGFTIAASYGDFDVTTPLDAPTAWRMILILRRA